MNNLLLQQLHFSYCFMLFINIRFYDLYKFIFARPPPVGFHRIFNKFTGWCIDWKITFGIFNPLAEFIISGLKKHLCTLDFKFRDWKFEAFYINLTKGIVMIIVTVNNLRIFPTCFKYSGRSFRPSRSLVSVTTA